MVSTAGEEKADGYVFWVEAPPPKAVNSSKSSMSAGCCESRNAADEDASNLPCMAMFGVCGTLPADCENRGT